MQYKLEDICLKITDGSHYSPSDDFNSDIPMLSVKDMDEFDFNYDNCKHISEEEYDKMLRNDCVPKLYDVLVAKDGSYLKEIFVNEKETKKAILSSIAIFRPNQEIVDSYFLCYLLKTPIILDYVKDNCVSGSALPRIILRAFKEIKLSIPSLEIQKKIVKIVKNINSKIRINNQINDNLLNTGKTYFEKYLSNCKEEISIRDIADEVLDYTKNKNDRVKLLNSSDITENKFPRVEFIDNKDLKGHFKKRFKKHDILYSQIRPRNHHYGYVLLEDPDDYLASTRFMVVRNKPDKVSSSLLYYYLSSKNAIDDFASKTESRSGTFPQGNYEDLSSFVVKYSSNQEVITKILDSILETINNNNNENDKLSELRDTLLPKLMNREIDLEKIKI